MSHDAHHQEKTDFARPTFYSLLNDSASDCNSLCGNGNTTCFKNCIVKNKALIDTMRDFLLYQKPRERNLGALL